MPDRLSRVGPASRGDRATRACDRGVVASRGAECSARRSQPNAVAYSMAQRIGRVVRSFLKLSRRPVQQPYFSAGAIFGVDRVGRGEGLWRTGPVRAEPLQDLQ